MSQSTRPWAPGGASWALLQSTRPSTSSARGLYGRTAGVEPSQEPSPPLRWCRDNWAAAQNAMVSDGERAQLVSAQVYEHHLLQSVKTAESQALNSFHCQTADCPGWCMLEDNVNVFLCPVCDHATCLQRTSGTSTPPTDTRPARPRSTST
ncbi:ranBP-type and C3HC4-type zinc finger-containing protein 1-like [Haemaphysalis longicornis]